MKLSTADPSRHICPVLLGSTSERFRRERDMQVFFCLSLSPPHPTPTPTPTQTDASSYSRAKRADGRRCQKHERKMFRSGPSCAFGRRAFSTKMAVSQSGNATARPRPLSRLCGGPPSHEAPGNGGRPLQIEEKYLKTHFNMHFFLVTLCNKLKANLVPAILRFLSLINTNITKNTHRHLSATQTW